MYNIKIIIRGQKKLNSESQVDVYKYFKRIYFLGSCVKLYFLLLLYCLCIINSYYYYSLLDLKKKKNKASTQRPNVL